MSLFRNTFSSKCFDTTFCCYSNKKVGFCSRQNSSFCEIKINETLRAHSNEYNSNGFVIRRALGQKATGKRSILFLFADGANESLMSDTQFGTILKWQTTRIAIRFFAERKIQTMEHLTTIRCNHINCKPPSSFVRK